MHGRPWMAAVLLLPGQAYFIDSRRFQGLLIPNQRLRCNDPSSPLVSG